MHLPVTALPQTAIAGEKTPPTISPGLYHQTSKWLMYDKPYKFGIHWVSSYSYSNSIGCVATVVVTEKISALHVDPIFVIF